MYTIKNDGSIYFAGMTQNEEQVLMGFHYPDLIAVLFGKDGKFVHVIKRGINTSDGLRASDSERDIFREMTQWQEEIGFKPGTIHILNFTVPELSIGISDMPAHFIEFAENPKRFENSQKVSLEKEMQKWKRRRDFVLNWNEEYWLNKNGEIVTS